MTEIDGWRRTQGEARADAFHYIEGFYSKRCLHSAAIAHHQIVLSQGWASQAVAEVPAGCHRGGSQEWTMQRLPLLPSARCYLMTRVSL